MKDKSIRDTAIITITLIGGLFLLQKCSGEETKIVKRDIKISQIKGHSQKNTLQEEKKTNSLIDSSYIKRDNEIVLASYKSSPDTQQKDLTHTISIEKNNSNINTIKIVVSNTKDNNKTIQTLITKAIDSNTSEAKDNNITEVIDSNISEAKDNNITEVIDSNISEVIDNKIT